MRLPSLFLGALLLATACGGSSDPSELVSSGERNLGIQDLAAARTDFDAALSALGDATSDPFYMRAKLGSIEAKADSDAAKAKDELLAFSKANPGKVTDRDFNRIAGRMGDAGHIEEATAVLEAGKQLYPESGHLDTLGERLAQKAKESGNSAAMDALKGLGYVGE